jgi:hypothetical protein
MAEIPESYKYCSDVLKYFGFVCLSPLGTLIFMFVTHGVISPTHNFPKEAFSYSLLCGLIGLKCILRGFEILSQFYRSQK